MWWHHQCIQYVMTSSVYTVCDDIISLYSMSWHHQFIQYVMISSVYTVCDDVICLHSMWWHHQFMCMFVTLHPSSLLEQCEPGSFSLDGLKPCRACPIGQYQPDHGRTICLQCGNGSRTNSTGGVSFQQCLVKGMCPSIVEIALILSSTRFSYITWNVSDI